MRDADSGDCVACPKGTYSDTENAASCTPCPEGQTTKFEGTNEASQCHIGIDYLTHFFENFRLLFYEMK